MEPHPPAAPDATSRRRSARIAAVGLLLMAGPFFFLGLWMLDRPARTELACAAGGADCTLVRAGWLTRTEVARFAPASLASARVDRNERRRASGHVFRPVIEVARTKQALTFRWAETADAAEALVARLHAFARAPREPLLFEDDARRATVGGASAFLGGGTVALGLALVSALRGWRRAG